MNKSGNRAKIALCLMVVVASIATSLFHVDPTNAAQLNQRKLTLGSSAPSASTSYTFNFTVPTTGTAIKSAQFQVCQTPNPGDACNSPTGFAPSTAGSQPTGFGAASGWTFTSVTGATNPAFRIANSGNSTNPSGSQQVVFTGATNPSTANQTFYVRITTYSDASWTTPIDTGSVAASTTQTIVVSGTMPEYLQFCTGGTITVTANVPDCSSATSGSIQFSQLFSASATATAQSMMAAATNASYGYVITTFGTTLTSGSNTIPAIGATPVASNTTQGTSYFGINLAQNTTTTSTPAVPSVAPIRPTSNTTDLRALASTGFATPDNFALDLTGATPIAKSDNGTAGSPAPTKSQAYAVSYMANVSAIQPAGTYVANINYICTPTF